MSIQGPEEEHTTRFWEEYNRDNQPKQRVAQLAIHVLHAHPEHFSMLSEKYSWRSSISAVTTFTGMIRGVAIPLQLSFGMTRWKRGDITFDIQILPLTENYANRYVASYDLNIGGIAMREQFERLSQQSESVHVDPLSMFGFGQDKDHITYSDLSVDPHVTPEEALDILKSASNFQRPTEGVYKQSMSYAQFQEQTEHRLRNN
jgi:hypothetical protein